MRDFALYRLLHYNYVVLNLPKPVKLENSQRRNVRGANGIDVLLFLGLNIIRNPKKNSRVHRSSINSEMPIPLMRSTSQDQPAELFNTLLE